MGPGQIIKNRINLDLIEIIQFCLKIYDLLTHPHLCVGVWVYGLMGGLICGSMETTWGQHEDNVQTTWGQHGATGMWRPHGDNVETTGCGDHRDVETMWGQHGDNMGTIGMWRPHGDNMETIWDVETIGMWRPCGDNMETIWGQCGDHRDVETTWGQHGDNMGTT